MKSFKMLILAFLAAILCASPSPSFADNPPPSTPSVSAPVMSIRVGQLVMQTAATGTGPGVPMIVGGLATGLFQVHGISSATVTFEGTIDGTNFVAVQATSLAAGTGATTTTADGLFRIDLRGFTQVRCRISAYSSGTITVTGNAVER